MKFNEKKEYYSLRKFKGVGLASALVGLAFLSPSVLAEETATPSAPVGEVGVVAPTAEPNKVEISNTLTTSESSKVENISVAPEVANVGNTSTTSEGSVKPEEVTKQEEVVKPEVSEIPAIPSLFKVEEGSQNVDTDSIEGTRANANKLESTEPSQPTRSRRGKRDVSSSEESTTGNIKLFGLDGDNATLVPATGREVVTAIDYTDGSNPQKAPVGDNYNNQISKVEILSTSTSGVRVRVSLVDGETIPEGGKIQLASLGASSFASNKLLMNSTVVGSGTISESSPNNKLSPRKDLESSLKSAATVEEYLSILKGLKRFDYPVSMINLTMNSSFSSYNKNRVLEFEFVTTSSSIYDSLKLKNKDLSREGIYNSAGSLEKPSKEVMGYIINPYDNSKIMNIKSFRGGASVNTPYEDGRVSDDTLKMSDSQSFGVHNLPYFLNSANIYPMQGLQIRGGVPSTTRNRLSVGDYIKTSLTNDSIFKSDISHKVDDVVEVSVRNSSPSKTSVESSPRFSDTDKYVVEKITNTGYSQEDTKVRLRLVELTDTTIKWELLDDVKLTKDQLYMGLDREFFNYSLREDWISRFGKDSLLNYLKSGGDPSKYTDRSKFKLTSEFSENGTPHSKDSYGSISRNPNIVWGDKYTGSVKVKYVLDTGELLKEVNLVDNQPWDTRTVVDLPEKFGEAMLYSTSETGLPNTFVGIGDRTITVTYKNPISEEISETPPTKKYVLDNSKEGTYKNEVVGTPNKVVRTVTYKFNKDNGWSEDVEDYIDVPGTPTVVTLGTKPTTEVTYQEFSTTYVADPTRTAGEKFTETAGVRGTTTVETTYSVNKETGVVTPTKGQPVVVAPRNAVVKVGTKPTVTETTIPVTTKYKADTSIDFGKEEVESQGQVGTRTTTVPKVLNTQDGAVSDGQPTTQETPMTPKVVKKGTKPTVTEKPINFTTVYEADETKGKGVRTDKVAGVNGKVITTTTYTLDESTGNVNANNPTERREELTNKVVTVGTAPTVTTKRIAYGVEYQRDDTVSASSPATVVQNGVDGEKRTTVTYSVNPTTGVVTDNAPVETTVAPKPQIEKLGTKPEDIVTTQDFKRTFVADENKVLGYRQVETQGVQGKTVVHRTYTLPENVPPVEDNGQAINYEFAVAIPHDSEPEVNAPINEVTRVGIKPKVDTQTVAITTKYVEDATLDFGQVVETGKGSEGRIVTTTTYRLNPTDGTTTPNEPTVVTTPMVQRVVKVGIKPKVVETSVDFTTRYESDDNFEAGKKTTSVRGIAGKVTTTTAYTMNPTTGVVTENPSTSMREEPTTEVVKVGTKPKVVVEKIEKVVRYEADPTKPKGEKETSVEGSDGSVTTTTPYVLNKENGSVTEGTPTVEKVPVVEKVVKVGTKPKVDVTTVPFTTSYEASPTSDNGTTSDKVVGKEGKVTTTTTYSVNPKTGEVTENPSTSVREEPVTRVVSVGSKSTTVVTEQNYSTRYIGNSSKDVGFRETHERGVKGTTSVTTTYSVDPTSGKVTLKEGSPVVVEPKEEVVALGTKPKVDVETIAKTTRYEKDPSSDKGVSTTSVEGSDGSKTTTTTYMVNPKTGEVTPNKPIVVTVPEVEQVVKVGGKTEVVRSKDSKGRDVIDTTTYEVNPKTGKVTSTTVRTYGTTKGPTIDKVAVSSPVRYEEDNEREVGSDNIVVKGKDGEDTITTTYLVNETTGKITSVVGKPVRTLEPTPTVVKVGAKPKVTETPIEPNVEYIKDGTRSVGEPNIVEQGVKGVSSVTTTYSVNPKTGEISENVGTPVINPAGKTLIKVAAKDKVEEVKLGGALVRRTTTYEVNPKTGEVTSLVSVKEDALSQTPNDAPKVEIPEFTGGVVPNDAPVLELPELKVPEEPAKPQPVEVPKVVEETPAPAPKEPVQENQLPNTGGGDSAITAAMGIVSLLAGLGITVRKSKED